MTVVALSLRKGLGYSISCIYRIIGILSVVSYAIIKFVKKLLNIAQVLLNFKRELLCHIHFY